VIVGKEGARKVSQHWRRERDSAAIRTFKETYRKPHGGHAPCEVCGFDFKRAYPSHETAYIEAHHRVPLSTPDADEGTTTEFDDMAFLCANCHRMIHRPVDGLYFTVEELADLLQPLL
jgi:predicted HNH restriction endonuclease